MEVLIGLIFIFGFPIATVVLTKQRNKLRKALAVEKAKVEHLRPLAQPPTLPTLKLEREQPGEATLLRSRINELERQLGAAQHLIEEGRATATKNDALITQLSGLGRSMASTKDSEDALRKRVVELERQLAEQGALYATKNDSLLTQLSGLGKSLTGTKELEDKLKDRELLNESLKLRVSQLEKALEPYHGVINSVEKQAQAEDAERAAKTSIRVLEERIRSLRKEINPLELETYARDFGLYEPTYSFETSGRYKAEIDQVRQGQKAMIKDGKAVYSPANWTVNGSSAAGRKMVKEITQLQMRAFNGEADGLIQKVRFDNILRIEERLQDLYRKINVLDGETGCFITTAYLELKLKELRLVHEYQERRQQEAEEQRALREQMREEEKAQRDFDKAQADAQRQEKLYQNALEKARLEVEQAQGERQTQLRSEIERLSLALQEAQEKNQRALSMAQQTKAGHVYVISNIGSFGENVYKIGMTRRLEPLERVRELSSASVPFGFDVHAIISSEDAPKLESELHRAFASRRVNQINQRKEFFRVSLEDIRAFVVSHHGEIDFTMAAEAADYRKTQVQQISA